MKMLNHQIKQPGQVNYSLILKSLYLLISTVGLLALVYDFGFNQNKTQLEILNLIYLLVLLSGNAYSVILYTRKNLRPPVKVWPVDAFIFMYFAINIAHLLNISGLELFHNQIWINIAIIIVFVRALAAVHFQFSASFLNPAQLFILSFAVIILSGAFMLLLPNATYTGISFIDALFTSTSAVCVTGLIVVDTGSYFTVFGQVIILILIQLGGIGIMTFTSYFGFFFKGGASYQNRLLIQDMNNDEKFDEVFDTLKKIIIVTFFVEAIGVGLIFFSIDNSDSNIIGNEIFFSIFHAISGFCNAGFSTLSNSFYDEAVRHNYFLHIVVACLFIIGGLGFPILFNTSKYLLHSIKYKLFRKHYSYQPWILGINARIVLITSFCLLFAGTIVFMLLEYNNTLKDYSFFGKIVASFFSAATPRTAGFNSVDTSALGFPTIMIVIFLMWIGASPGSTGGGVKTSTFAIAILNFISIAKGKDRVEAFKREISIVSIRRAFSILSLSIIVIGASVLLLSVTDGNKGLLPIAFESFSAFSTVGLSLGITNDLSYFGKIVIIFTMFIGRVSMLTILVAILRRFVNLKYKYPVEDILIN